MTNLLTVGKHKITGDPVFIESARNGLKCNAVCPSCGRELEARQGNSNDWSFAHDNSDTERPACTAPYETALHFLAKWIIKQGNRIKLPGGRYFEYDQANIERPVDRFRIDVYLFNTASTQTLLVEIIVHNPLEKGKIEELTQLDYRVLEIDLSSYDGALAEESMTSLLLDSIYGKTLHKRRVSFPKLPVSNFNPLPGICIALAVLLGIFLFWKPKKR